MGVPSLPLKDRVAVVTGAGGVNGIGRAVALGFADAGADVAVCDIVVKEENWDLEGTAEEIRKLGRRSLAVQVDVTNESDVVSFIDKVVKEFGTIDILMNSVGAAAHSSLEGLTLELWDESMDINVKSAYLCCRAASKIMKERNKGVMINMSSLSGIDAAGASVYGVSKQAVVTLTRWLGWELAPNNIRVNAIAPGGVKVERLREFWSNPESYQQAVSIVPMKRMAEPSEMVGVTLFLASDDASGFMTGQTVIVDGGQTM